MDEIKTFEFHRVIGSDNLYGETLASVKRRIAAVTGFDICAIYPIKSDNDGFTVGEERYRYCTRVFFTVNGHGWATDFARLERAPQFDDAPKGARADA